MTGFILPARGFSHMIKSDKLGVCFGYFVLSLFLTLLFVLFWLFCLSLFVCVCGFSKCVCPCKFVGQRRTGVCQEKLWGTEHSAVGGDPWFYWEVYVFSGGLSQELCHGTEPIILWNSTRVWAAITGTFAYYSNWAKVLIKDKIVRTRPVVAYVFGYN